jgi:hypothetical protein
MPMILFWVWGFAVRRIGKMGFSSVKCIFSDNISTSPLPNQQIKKREFFFVTAC